VRHDLWVLGAVVVALAGCGGGGGLSEDTPSDFCNGRLLVEPALPETLEGNHYLSAEVGTYTVATSLYLAEGTLCIEPGVRVEIARGGRVVVGSDREAALVAVGKRADGTPDPIVFTSAQPAPHIGDWDKIHFTPKNLADVSVLDTVVIEYAGAYDQHGKANVTIEGTSVALRDVRLRKGLGLGLNFETADAFPSEFSGVYFESLGGGALALELRHLARLAGGASMGEGVDHALLRGGGLYESATLPAWGVPWQLLGDSVGVQNGAVLTIQPGVTVQVGSGVRLTAGGQTEGGFAFEGTAEAPIVLQSAEVTPGPGDWDKLVITPKTSRAVFRHVTLRHAGQLETSGGKAALVVGGPIDELTDVHIEDSAGYCLIVQDGAPLPAAIDGLEVVSSALAAISLNAAQLALVADVTLPADAAVIVRAGSLVGDADLSAVPHVAWVEGRIDVNGGGSLRLGAGTTWRFAAGAGLWVGGVGGEGTLVAEGTAAAPLRFTSVAESPAAGAWDKLVFGPGCQSRGCSLKHAVVEFGGGSTTLVAANVAVAGSDPALDDVAITDGAGWGLWLDGAAEPILGTISYARNATGDQYQEP